MSLMSNALPTNFRSGYVSITGLPNVGKSTFLNRAVDEPLAIVTPKPQTTRNRILGIHHGEGVQIVFIDTPGVCRELSRLNRYLNKEVFRALGEADLVLFMVDAVAPPSEAETLLAGKIAGSKKPAILLFNKIDALRDKGSLLERQAALSEVADFREVLSVSALKDKDVKGVLKALARLLPAGPPFFGEDEYTTADMRFLVSEMIREQVFRQTSREIPYSTAVVVRTYREPEEGSELLRIEADIVVEKNSQKGIIIGAGAKRLKGIGQSARRSIEAFTGSKVFLALFVKVRKNWTRNEAAMKDLGYR